jgi:hypothetical protein
LNPPRPRDRARQVKRLTRRLCLGQQRDRNRAHIGDDAEGVAQVQNARLSGNIGRRVMQPEETLDP